MTANHSKTDGCSVWDTLFPRCFIHHNPEHFRIRQAMPCRKTPQRRTRGRAARQGIHP
jgi:hypothetical protein